jgi:hypothetical protein
MELISLVTWDIAPIAASADLVMNEAAKGYLHCNCRLEATLGSLGQDKGGKDAIGFGFCPDAGYADIMQQQRF